MRSLLKFLLLFIIGTIVSARITGLIVARQRDEGTEASDEFCRVVVMNGVSFTSRADALRRGEVSVVMGGVKLDLSEATLDPAGARLTAENTLGRLAVIVPADWAVTVNEEVRGGGDCQVRVTEPDDLPERAPKLHIDLVTRMGGSIVSTGSVDV